MVRLIAVDLDGTLLDGRNRIAGRSIRILQKALDMGIYVVPATGRCIGLLPKELQALVGLRYAVTENGALTWDFQKEQEWRRISLPPDQAAAVLKLTGGMNAYAEVFCHGQAYADIRCLDGIERSALGGNFIRYFTEDHNFLRDLDREWKLLSEAEKVNLYFADSSDAERVRRCLETDRSISVSTSIGGNVEVAAAGADKGRALGELADMLLVDRKDILAFGDNENDLGMFKIAGTAVAMGNAGETIRAAADFVAGTNDELGAAIFLEKILNV